MSARARWLARAPLGDAGAVLSWVNPAHPGYPYPEIAGLWLRFAARQGAPSSAVDLVRERLRDDGASGLVGRAGLSYAFDTAAALGGLVATGAVGAAERRMFGLFRGIGGDRFTPRPSPAGAGARARGSA